jgi:hypothetical protein
MPDYSEIYGRLQGLLNLHTYPIAIKYLETIEEETEWELASDL